MSTLRSKLIRLAYENPKLKPEILPLLRESATILQSRFPSHELARLDTAYDHLNTYYARLKKDRDPLLATHKDLLNTSMNTFASLLAKLKKVEASLYTAKFGSVGEWKVEFPSHSVREEVGKIYNSFNRFNEQLQRQRGRIYVDSKRMMNDALNTYVALIAQLKKAERALYSIT